MNYPQRARAWIAALALVIAALVVGLVAPATLAAPAAQEGDVLNIGYLGMAGSASANGAQLAIEQINAIGGVTALDGTRYTLNLLTMPLPLTPENLSTSIDDFVRLGASVILGPDSNDVITAENFAAMRASTVPILSSATLDRLTNDDLADIIFRTRAPERAYSYALAETISTDLGLNSIVLVQTDVASTEALLSFEAQMGVRPALKVQMPDGSDIPNQVQRIIGVLPQAVVMWGPVEDAAALLRGLRQAGWTGVFAYRNADQLVQSALLTDDETSGMLGANSWSYATPNDATRIFLRDYAITFGQVPNAHAAAAYDAVWFLRGVVQRWGSAPADIQAGLIGGAPQTLVQGTLHPLDYGNGDLARLTVVYRVRPFGGQEVIALFDDITRLALTPAEQPTPEPTPAPLVTVPPTATLSGAWVEVNVNVLNVRSGPAFEYDRVTQINRGERYRILGAIPDYSWLLIDISGAVGWVKTEYVLTIGDLTTVSIVAPPPTPTIGATLTPTLAPVPDIVIDAAVLSPAQPVPGQPFSLTVTVRNAGGGAAGRFAVAATLQPGNVYMAVNVDGLAGGQATQVQLTGTLAGTGVFTEAVVADLNKEVSELDENNNTFNVSYRADYPLFAQQANLQLSPGQEWDLYGGMADVQWDGYNLGMRNGAMIGLIGGTYENAHYDMLQPGLINNAVGLTTDQVLVGSVYGMTLAEGRRAVLRIDNRQDQTIWISYRVYNAP